MIVFWKDQFFDGICFWIKIQKGNTDEPLEQGFGDEPATPVVGENLGAYLIRARLKSADEVISDEQYFNYFGLNIDY